jgi:hypothetical protein
MKKLLVLAMMATLLMAGSAFAGKLSKTPDATFAFGGPGIASGPTTTNNDDSCDISTAPAATLLLPYFEVDFNASSQAVARTTLFTITNVSRYPQIAHVVLWTDFSYAALDFNIFLTGYDVQAINMYDIFARGIIAPGATPGVGGTSITTPIPNNAAAPANSPGGQPASNTTGNPNFNAAATTTCVGLLGPIPIPILNDLRVIFTTGAPGANIGAGCAGRLGGSHANAIGYVTVDVSSNCTTSLPGPGYFNSEVLFDNVLIGDYQDINPNPATGNYAGGNPMTHIRAIPEGGPAGSIPGTNLPYTFYDRYTTAVGIPRTVDRRQPLPSTFAARYIQGGTGAFNTNYKIWREGVTGPSSTACAVTANGILAIAEIVRFDEHENATTIATGPLISPQITTAVSLPETSSTSTSNSSVFPALSTSGDVGGWMYLNLNNGGSANYSTARPGFAGAGTSTPVAGVRQSQNWVIVSMFAEGRSSVDFDAAWLGNGCSVSPPVGSAIGPTGNNTGGVYQQGALVCPTPIPGNTVPCTGNPAYLGTNQTP